MFRLVGTEQFKIGSKPAEIVISSEGMSFKYLLNVDGKSLTKFIEAQAKNTRVWLPVINKAAEHRVVLGEWGGEGRDNQRRGGRGGRGEVGGKGMKGGRGLIL